MNQQNLDYLKGNLRYLGFGEKLHADLEKNIQQGFPEFVLRTEPEFSKKKMEAALHFRKSDQSDLYFFNRYDATLHHREDPSKNLQQTFYINKGQGITLREAYNLLEGRAVHKELTTKEGEKYQAWVQLNLKQKEENGNYKMKQYHQNYGYDLKAAVSLYPIRELKDELQRDRLFLSLEKGNVQAVTMEVGGKEERFFIEANPQYKSVTVYDGHLKLISREQRDGLLMGPVGRDKSNGKEVKTEVPAVEPEGKKKSRPAVKDEKVKGLLPQKEKRARKGMGIRG